MLLPCLLCVYSRLSEEDKVGLASTMLTICRRIDPEEIVAHLCTRHRHAHEISREITEHMLERLIAGAKATES